MFLAIWPWSALLWTYISVSISSALSRNNVAVLELNPGAKITRPEGSRLVVNCTSHSGEAPVKMVWNASRAHSTLKTDRVNNRTVALIFDSLHRSDAGFYTCFLILPKGKKYLQTVHVSVIDSLTLGNLNPCAPTQFRCENGHCIFLQYRCDNRNDCEDNSDEKNCGDKCASRFVCENKRCISYDLVCDKFHNNDCGDMSDEKCTLVKPPFSEWYPSQSAATSHPQQTSVDVQMRWLKTTVYSVIGCTVGVVLLIAILVMAIFRIKMKRTAARRQMLFLERRRRQRAAARHLYRFPESDAFIPSQNQSPPYSNNSIILNVNNGVQYVPGLEFTSLTEPPPPYSDSGSPPARGRSPPPPYSTLDRRITNCEAEGDNQDTIHLLSGCERVDDRSVSDHQTDSCHTGAPNSALRDSRSENSPQNTSPTDHFTC